MTVADRLRALVDVLPDGSSVTLPAAVVRSWLAAEPPAAPPASPEPEPESWREKLWTVPAETRLGVKELAESLDRSPDWCYRAVSPKVAAERGRDALPCQRLDGCLSFTAGAVREWIRRSEVVVTPPPRRLKRA